MTSFLNLLLFILIFTLFTNPARAYLDPGTGSYFFQLIVGLLLGSVLAIKIYFRKLKYFILRIFSGKKSRKIASLSRDKEKNE